MLTASPRTQTVSVVVVVAIGLLLRVGLWAVGPEAPGRHLREDSPGYLELAGNLQRQHALIRGAFMESQRTPGYPLFLSAVWSPAAPDVRPALALQIALSLITIALTFKLASAIGGYPVGLLASLLVAIDPPSITHSLLILSETLFTVLMVAGLLWSWRARDSAGWRPAAAAGLMLGLATLVRPVGLYFTFVVAAWLLIGKGAWRWGATVALLVAGLVPPGLWMERNARSGFGYTMSTIQECYLLVYIASPVLARATGQSWKEADGALWAEVAKGDTDPDHPWSPEQRDRMRAIAVRILRTYPFTSAQMFAEGIGRMWLGPGQADLAILTGRCSSRVELGQLDLKNRPAVDPCQVGGPLVALAFLVVAVNLAGMVRGIVALWRAGNAAALTFILCVLGYFTAVSSYPGAYARLRVPVVPVAVTLSAIGLHAAWLSRQQSRVTAPTDPA